MLTVFIATSLLSFAYGGDTFWTSTSDCTSFNTNTGSIFVQDSGRCGVCPASTCSSLDAHSNPTCYSLRDPLDSTTGANAALTAKCFDRQGLTGTSCPPGQYYEWDTFPRDCNVHNVQDGCPACVDTDTPCSTTTTTPPIFVVGSAPSGASGSCIISGCSPNYQREFKSFAFNAGVPLNIDTTTQQYIRARCPQLANCNTWVMDACGCPNCHVPTTKAPDTTNSGNTHTTKASNTHTTQAPDTTNSGNTHTTKASNTHTTQAGTHTTSDRGTTKAPDTTKSGNTHTTQAPDTTTSGNTHATKAPDTTTPNTHTTQAGNTHTTKAQDTTKSGNTHTTSDRGTSTTKASDTTKSGNTHTTQAPHTTKSGNTHTTQAPDTTKSGNSDSTQAPDTTKSGNTDTTRADPNTTIQNIESNTDGASTTDDSRHTTDGTDTTDDDVCDENDTMDNCNGHASHCHKDDKHTFSGYNALTAEQKDKWCAHCLCDIFDDDTTMTHATHRCMYHALTAQGLRNLQNDNTLAERLKDWFVNLCFAKVDLCTFADVELIETPTDCDCGSFKCLGEEGVLNPIYNQGSANKYGYGTGLLISFLLYIVA